MMSFLCFSYLYINHEFCFSWLNKGKGASMVVISYANNKSFQLLTIYDQKWYKKTVLKCMRHYMITTNYLVINLLQFSASNYNKNNYNITFILK